MPLGLDAVALAVLVALAVDRWWGEPPSAWHPVVWMGRALDRLGRWAAPGADAGKASQRRVGPFLRGTAGWCLGALVVVALAVGVQYVVQAAPAWLAVVLLGLCLKPMFAWRMLRDEVVAVEQALSESLEAGRQRLSWLCSRDVSQLSPEQVRETALETLAENLSDSVVAPLFWFAVAGLPGAALYRWANTADAMWGYTGVRQGRVWTWAGKWAARADDALNWVPARLTGLGLMVLGARKRAAWARWPAQARVTPSPNGGWPMAALALVLGVRLGKPDVYTLNPAGRPPLAAETPRALAAASAVVGLCAGVAVLGAAAALWQAVGSTA